MKLDLGSGYIKRKGFKSVDIDKKVNPDILADIRTLKPVSTESIDEVFCSHTLEHILPKDLFKTLRSIYRILKPTGKVTIVVPNIKAVSDDWISGMITSKHYESIILGSDPTATKFMLHKNIFYPEKIKRFLQITGFASIRISNHSNNYQLITTARKPKEKQNAQPKSTSRNRRH